jgi:hypothetical protein
MCRRTLAASALYQLPICEAAGFSEEATFAAEINP